MTSDEPTRPTDSFVDFFTTDDDWYQRARPEVDTSTRRCPTCHGVYTATAGADPLDGHRCSGVNVPGENTGRRRGRLPDPYDYDPSEDD